MIVAGLLLILVAGALLVLGLALGSSVQLVGSIAASLLAAVALVVGARQASSGRTDVDQPIDASDQDAGDGAGRRATDPGGRDGSPSRRDPRREPTRTSTVDSEARVPRQAASPAAARPGGPGRSERAGTRPGRDAGPSGDAPLGDAPVEEPPAQAVPPALAARVARMLADVLVIDGRPRYHLPGCAHLRGREGESLPVSEAIELGFSPCASCEPATALLTDAHRA